MGCCLGLLLGCGWIANQQSFAKLDPAEVGKALSQLQQLRGRLQDAGEIGNMVTMQVRQSSTLQDRRYSGNFLGNGSIILFMSKLSQEQLSELERIKERASMILEYIGKVTPPGMPTFHTQLLEVLNQTCEKEIYGV